MILIMKLMMLLNSNNTIIKNIKIYMKYLNAFENKSLYNDYITSTGIAPHVGYITDINKVKYKN